MIVARPLAHGSTNNHQDESQQTFIPVSFSTGWDCQRLRIHDVNGVAPTMSQSDGKGGHRVPLIAFSSKDDGRDAAEIAPTLRSMNYADSHMNGGGQVAIAFNNRQDPITSEVGQPIGAQDNGQGVLNSCGVRRLTPTECERLQGFPDNWTDGQADSVRYRQLGNAIAVPVARWIAERIMLTEPQTNTLRCWNSGKK